MPMLEIKREDIVAEARSWIGTPYVHQASTKHVGCDCIGFVRGLWRTFLGAEPGKVPSYTRLWAEHAGDETLLNAAESFMFSYDPEPLRRGAPFDLGDVILLRMVDGGPAKHAVVTSGGEMIIHSYAGHSVLEAPMPRNWRMKIAGAYTFPGVA